MLRLPALVVVPLAIIVLLSSGASVPSMDRTTAVPDSAIQEYEAGRFWHAARILRAESERDLELRIWLARAEAGYRNWNGVLEALEGVNPEGAAVVGSSPGEVWSLRALALDESDRDVEAEDAWARALELGVDDPAVAWGRRARIRLEALPEGRAEPAQLVTALEALDAVAEHSTLLASAVAADALEGRVEAGDTAGYRQLLARSGAPFTPDDAWELRPRVLVEAGDTAGAAAAWETVRLSQGGTPAARAAEALGDIARARGDVAVAADLYLEALNGAPGTTPARRAARGVVDLVLEDLDVETALLAARSLDRLGDGRRALIAYDRYVELVEATDNEPLASARVERARIAATVPARLEEALEEFRALDEHPDPTIGVRTLTVWGDLRRRQGQTGNYQTIRGWLVDRYPDSDPAAEIVFLRADAAQDRGALDAAIDTYEQVITMAPERSFAGQARMRVAQILLGREDSAGAAEVYEAYLADFPTGRRWEEAAYWAARLRLELGQTAQARAHIERLQRDSPLTYYSVRASALVGEDFRLEVLGVSNEPAVPDPLDMPLLDQLESVGLESAADRWVSIRSGEIRDSEGLLRLAEALNARGRTLQGINLGWRLQDEGMAWSRRLVEVVYPFIYREMVLREAAEWGLDPVLVSALIRQESAWVADIRSSAGAIGLMQVMPATGAQVARADGMDGFSPAALETPEVNLHLGARFLSDLLARYGDDLPLVLSAYNAGPTRADRWRNFPEAVDRERFTERIPFAETRGYVKNVTRNVELYEALYGPALRPLTQ